MKYVYHQIKKAYARRWSQTYLRGRASYTGDRFLPNAATYLYEGYAGANVGDEIIFNTVQELLSPAHAVFSGRFMPPMEYLRCRLGISRASAVVFGGGTIRPFHTLKDPRFGLEKLPLFAFGVGGEEFTSGNNTSGNTKKREAWLTLLDNVEVKQFGVRGPQSLQMFKEFVPSAVATGDTALAAYDFIERQQLGFIGVNFGRHFPSTEKHTLNTYGGILEDICSLGLPVMMIPLHHSDRLFMEQVLHEHPQACGKNLLMLGHIPTSLQFRNLFANMAMGIGERLHFSIPLFASGIPSIMLAYSDKHSDFASSINADKYVIQLEDDMRDSVFARVASVASSGFLLENDIRDAVCSLRSSLRECLASAQRELLQVANV